jgi:2-amino-4-hydroxy-6-hydroxymethyldihydropteridine diphosphokinase
MSITALLLGSNLGDRQENLLKALAFIEQQVGSLKRKSSVYKTAPWGNIEQDDFLNLAILAETKFTAHEVLKKLLEIEKKLGRERIEKWGPRTIDIDILYYDNEVINNKDLVVPHPHLQDRRFSLVPLNEISADWQHPVLHKTVSQMLEDCEDRGEVTVFESRGNK